MPIHNLGYRGWSGRLLASSSRWTVVAGISIRRAWQGAWVRRLVFMAWVPAVMMGVLIFAYENISRDGSEPDLVLQRIAGSLLGFNMEAARERRYFWSWMLLVVLKRSQVTLVIPMVGLIAPPLISQDIRSRAFLLYFSRPMSQLQYIIGKAATLMLFMSLITLLPALLLYVTGVLLSPDLSVVSLTWDLPLRATLASFAIMIPCTSLALMFSSMTTESRYASFAWFAVWIFGYVTVSIMTSVSTAGGSTLIELLSLHHLLGSVCDWLLNPEAKTTAGLQNQIVFLTSLTAVSTAILFRRVSAPMKI